VEGRLHYTASDGLTPSPSQPDVAITGYSNGAVYDQPRSPSIQSVAPKHATIQPQHKNLQKNLISSDEKFAYLYALAQKQAVA
jgi:hypothetical protein